MITRNMHEYKSRSIEAPRDVQCCIHWLWIIDETHARSQPKSPIPIEGRRVFQKVIVVEWHWPSLVGWQHFVGGESIITNLRGNCSSFRFPFIFIIASHVVATLCARFTQLKVRMQIVNFSNPTRIASSMTQKRRQKGAFILRSCFAPLPVPERDKQRFRSRILIKDGMKWFITLRETIPLKALFPCLSRRVFLEASESELFSVRDMM